MHFQGQMLSCQTYPGRLFSLLEYAGSMVLDKVNASMLTPVAHESPSSSQVIYTFGGFLFVGLSG